MDMIGALCGYIKWTHETRRGLGKEIAAIRMRLGLTQKELAKRVGCHQPYISGLESGSFSPTPVLLTRVALALDDWHFEQKHGLTDEVDFGADLLAKRANAGLTQQELADRSGYSRVHICNLERGMYKPSTRTAATLAKVFDGENPPGNGRPHLTARLRALGAVEKIVVPGAASVRQYQ